MCLDALHDRGLRRINIGIARYAFRALGESFRWAAVLPVATGLLKISPYYLTKQTGKETSSNLQISPKFTPKCCIILH